MQTRAMQGPESEKSKLNYVANKFEVNFQSTQKSMNNRPNYLELPEESLISLCDQNFGYQEQ